MPVDTAPAPSPTEEPAAEPLPLRYMGNKRALAPDLARLILRESGAGRVADLFAGMACVAVELAPKRSVVLSDALEFVCCLARVRFVNSGQASMTAAQHVVALKRRYEERRRELSRFYHRRLAREAGVLASSADELDAYIEDAAHVGNSEWYWRRARACADQDFPDHYSMTTLYFASSYFSTQQAIELDAIRCAIDTDRATVEVRDFRLAAWIMTAARLINAPGHTAQFLRPGTEAALKRIRRQWRREVWCTFEEMLTRLRQVGSEEWRSNNTVIHGDALDIVKGERIPGDVSVVYADPPYTQDQYSRYYHVYETMLRYDFPRSEGTGRYPEGRHVTALSSKRRVGAAFRDLCFELASADRTLVLSYPTNGLLFRRGFDVRAIMRDFFSELEEREYCHRHSSLGAAHGEQTVPATELVLIARP